MIDKLHSIFNVDFVSYNESEVLIEEREPGAIVKEIKLVNADFFSFNKELLDRTNELFKDNVSKNSLAMGCDGLVLFKNKE